MSVLKELKDGYRKFHTKDYKKHKAYYDKLAKEGQAPEVMIIACSDSRVSPTKLFKTHPGKIFVVRNIANMVMPFSDKNATSVGAALEFAVKHLKVKHIIVKGHSQCGGIKALLAHDPHHHAPHDASFIDDWVAAASPARKRAEAKAQASGEPIQHVCEQESIIQSLENLMTYPWLKERVESGDLQVHGWYFRLEGAELMTYNPKTKSFVSALSDNDNPAKAAQASRRSPK